MATPKPTTDYATKYLAGAGYDPYKTTLKPVLAVKPKPKPTPQKITVNPWKGIETPEQIEARVRRVSQEEFDRQRNTLREEADALRREAANRRASQLAAYRAASELNGRMGADVQAGWQSAGTGITSAAGAITGGIGEALRGALSADQAQLAAAGAPELAYDATSQQGVENYRGGFLPRAYFEAMGGTGRQYMNEAAMALNARGVQTGMLDETQALQEIDKGLLSGVRELTSARSTYEAELRKQLTDASNDQRNAYVKAQSDAAKLRLAAQKQLDYLRVKKAELDSKYRIAMLSATTAAQKLQVDQWYKTNSLRINGQKANAYAANQQASAILSGVKAQAGGFAPKTPTNPTLTPNQRLTARQKADVAARNAAHGVMSPAERAKGERGIYTADPIGYQQALSQLMQNYGLEMDEALTILNRYYTVPGQGGRPLLNYRERQALSPAKHSKLQQIENAWNAWDRDNPDADDDEYDRMHDEALRKARALLG